MLCVLHIYAFALLVTFSQFIPVAPVKFISDGSRLSSLVPLTALPFPVFIKQLVLWVLGIVQL